MNGILPRTLFLWLDLSLTPTDNPLALSTALTAKTRQLCLGLGSGAADILELVTPTTAELLLWWFGEEMVAARGGLNFHAGQKQAILNAIVAHEVLGQGSSQSRKTCKAPRCLATTAWTVR